MDIDSLYDAMVARIRIDCVVGDSTYSSIAQLWDDQDLIEAFKELPEIASCADAVRWARKTEIQYLEKHNFIFLDEIKKLDANNPVVED